MFHTVIRRATLSLVALFAFFFASIQTAFADEAQDSHDNVEIIPIADNAGQDNGESNPIADNADQDSDHPKITTDASILESEDWLIIPEDQFGPRIGTDIGFGILYSGAIAGLGYFMWVQGTGEGSKACEGLGPNSTKADKRSCEKKKRNQENTGYFFMALGGFLGPALAVHTSHAIWGGEGSIGWTYLGALIGGAVGTGLGSLTFLTHDSLLPGVVIGPAAFLCGMIGAILGYELTDSKNREIKYGTISRVYPVLEFGPERNVVGVGIEF